MSAFYCNRSRNELTFLSWVKNEPFNDKIREKGNVFLSYGEIIRISVKKFDWMSNTASSKSILIQ